MQNLLKRINRSQQKIVDLYGDKVCEAQDESEEENFAKKSSNFNIREYEGKILHEFDLDYQKITDAFDWPKTYLKESEEEKKELLPPAG